VSASATKVASPASGHGGGRSSGGSAVSARVWILWRMPRWAVPTSSPNGSPTSQENASAAYFPAAVSSSANARIAVVLPVCRGAWITK
jgi:hypothetical protein